MTQAIPYLSFNGNCADAARFYEKALKGTLQALLRGADTPMCDEIPEDQRHLIMHACLVLPGGGLLYAGDCPPHMPYEGIKGVSITVDYPTVEEAEEVFNALADGGTVTMPMSPAFWAKRFGMVTDKFGTPWIVAGEPIPFGQ